MHACTTILTCTHVYTKVHTDKFNTTFNLHCNLPTELRKEIIKTQESATGERFCTFRKDRKSYQQVQEWYSPGVFEADAANEHFDGASNGRGRGSGHNLPWETADIQVDSTDSPAQKLPHH